MALINGISLPHLRNTEFAQFITDILQLVQHNDPDALNVATAYADLKAQNDELIKLLNPDTGSTLTAQIEAADDRRDLCITGINLVVAGYTSHYDATLRNHALTLQRHLTLFGGSSLARENYQSETAGITSLLSDWTDNAELAAAITALNLTGWKEELDAANKAFNELYLNRTQESSNQNLPKVRDMRKDIIGLYYKLRDRIASFYIIEEGAAPYSTVVNQMNTLIDQYNLLLESRKTTTTVPE